MGDMSHPQGLCQNVVLLQVRCGIAGFQKERAGLRKVTLLEGDFAQFQQRGGGQWVIVFAAEL